ncbi:MAG: biotin/lipoate--protein ligase family protein, partial [Alphaproteobacteria bacterium]
RAGVVRLAVDPAAGAGVVPDWMVVSAEVVISTDEVVEENWRKSSEFEHTSLAEEGGGHISRTRLVESCSRHFLVWVNRWQDDGFRPLY